MMGLKLSRWSLPQPECGLVIFLFLFICLGLILSLDLPLGESPDEPAHFSYIHFIAEHGRPPINQAERDEVGYRAKWPPLYQALVAPVVRLTENKGPEKLKNMHADARYLLPLGGFGGMTFLHTDDEAWPFRGIVRSWHAARVISVLLGAGTLSLIFLTLRRRFSGWSALAMVVAVGLIPEFVAINAAVNDDNLLGFVVALFLWLMWPLFEQDGSPWRYLILGMVAGAALMTKYSTLLLPLSLILLHLICRRSISLRQVVAFAGGYIIVAGWWFGFVIYFFNQIERFGWLRGTLAPFLAGGADLTTRQIATAIGVDSAYAPAFDLFAADWSNWLKTIFVTLWFRELGGQLWLWQVMVGIVLFLIVGVGLAWRRSTLLHRRQIRFAIGFILLFIPLPLLRFVLSQNIIETAQGRHILFPALLPLAFLIGIGLRGWFNRWATFALMGLGAFFVGVLILVVWPRITFARTPYFPVRTELARRPEIEVDANYAGEIRLLGLNRPAETNPLAVPLTLIWQAEQEPGVDYSVRLELQNTADEIVGLWQGQMANGRLPSRAWDKGDVVYHTVWIPILPGTPSGNYALAVQLLDDSMQPIPNDDGSPVLLIRDILAYTTGEIRSETPQARLIPRGDRFETSDPYRYRSTIAMVITGYSSPFRVLLSDPQGRMYESDEVLAGAAGEIVLFMVDWRWPTGAYNLTFVDDAGRPQTAQSGLVSIFNNRRLSEPPSISRPVEANFNNQFKLLGYDLPVKRVEPGQSFAVTLYWQSLQTTDTSYKVFNHLLDATQTQRGGQDRVPQVFYSTILWSPGEVVVDQYEVPVFADAPAGIYWLDVGLYPAEDVTAPALPLVEAGQVQDRRSVRLGPVKVGGQPAISQPPQPPAEAKAVQFGEIIALDGYTLAFDETQKQVDLALYWQATATPPLDYTLFIHVVDMAGEVVRQGDGPPVEGQYPTSFWEAGETIYDQRRVSLADLPAGTYQLRLGWYDSASFQRLAVPDQPEGFVTLAEVAVK